MLKIKSLQRGRGPKRRGSGPRAPPGSAHGFNYSYFIRGRAGRGGQRTWHEGVELLPCQCMVSTSWLCVGHTPGSLTVSVLSLSVSLSPPPPPPPRTVHHHQHHRRYGTAFYRNDAPASCTTASDSCFRI